MDLPSIAPRNGATVWIWGTAVVLAATSVSCGLVGGPEDGFTAFEPCVLEVDGQEACVVVRVRDWNADRYEATVVSETDEAVRIRLDAMGAKTNDDLVRAFRVSLGAPIGDREVIDDTTGESVERSSRSGW